MLLTVTRLSLSHAGLPSQSVCVECLIGKENFKFEATVTNQWGSQVGGYQRQT